MQHYLKSFSIIDAYLILLVCLPQILKQCSLTSVSSSFEKNLKLLNINKIYKNDDKKITLPQTTMFNYSGDIILAAIFPIHEREVNYTCGSLQILPGIDLGVMVVDSCDNPHHALEQTIDFIKSFVTRSNNRMKKPELQCSDESTPFYKYGMFDRVIGIIGGQSSEVSLQLANILRLFRIPQISYMSTSPTLSDKRLYQYFFRTVPSDTNQVDAIVEILRLFHWTYVSVVYSDTEYGNNGYNLLTAAAARNKICISSPQAIDVERFRPEDYDNLITNLMHKINARVVIVYTDNHVARKIMLAAERRLKTNNLFDRFVWVASDAWCCRERVTNNLEKVIEGSISVTPMHYPVQGFSDYFSSLKPKNNLENPWFAEFWMNYFKCRLPSDLESKNNELNLNESKILFDNTTENKICDESLSLGDDLPQTPSLHFVRDAIYSFAMTFDQVHKKVCNGTPSLCSEMADLLQNGEYVAQQLRKVKFKDEGGQTFRFQSNGDASPRYTVVNFQQSFDGTYHWMPVGTYMMAEDEKFAHLKINMSLLKFKQNLKRFPKSFCSEPCGSGQAKLQLEGDTCCWLCTNCSQYQFLPDDYHCDECPLGTMPNTNKTKCFPVPKIYLSLTDWWTISAIGMATIGAVCTILTCIAFWYYRKTPIIKASGQELSYLHLAGIFLSFTMTFLIVAKPTPLICGLNRFFLGFCYTVCYAAIVTKANRIARIFQHQSKKKLRFTSPRSQMIITTFLILIEVFINLIWFFHDMPNTKTIYPNREIALLICAGSDRTSYLLGLLYPLILIGFCTVYAFKTRKCPFGFNEARYITFTNYTTCVIWFAFLPLFVMLSTTTPLRSITLSSLLSVSGAVQLCCLFVPKIYIAILKPEKNTREMMMCGGTIHRSLISSNNNFINRKLINLNITQTTLDRYSISSENNLPTNGKNLAEQQSSRSLTPLITMRSSLSTPDQQQYNSEKFDQLSDENEERVFKKNSLILADSYDNEKIVNKNISTQKQQQPTTTELVDQEERKHDTKVILENGHKNWPSILLESKC